MMEAVPVSGAIRCAKDPVKSSPQTNQQPTCYWPDALPVTLPTVQSTEGRNITFHGFAQPKLT